MFTIRKATSADCGLIHKLAWQIFPETYKEILSKEQIEYMMEWMYSLESIRQQMEEEGHVYLIACEECEAGVGECQSCHGETEKETGSSAKGNQNSKDRCSDGAGD